MRKYISRFHYLTQDLSERSHIDQARSACEAGAKWIQYRCFSKNEDALLAEIHEIASVCDDWGATLIVTDHVYLAEKADIQGFHIEDMSADFTAVRDAIGPDKTLGASANTFENIQRIAQTGVVDYIGCGPFAITHTKPNDYPLLGTDGYRSIIEKMKETGIDIPVLAVGGVNLNDTDALITTGIYGIAVSAAVNLTEDPAKAFKEFYRKLH